MADMGALFAPSAAAVPPTRAESDAKKAKLHPERLAKWNSVAARALKPTGVSDLHAASLKDLWEWAKKGDKNCPYFTELAADESQGGLYRQGVGLSKVAEVVAAAIKELEKEHYGKFIDKTLYQAIMAEATQLKPILAVLDGKSQESYVQAAGSMSRRRRVAAVSHEQADAAAKGFRNWLALPQSKLRAAFAVLSGGGVFWAAQAAEKSARAWKDHAPVDEDHMVSVARARLCGEAPEGDAVAVDDTAGLF